MRIRTAWREFDWKGWLGWMTATMAGIQLAVLIIFFSDAAKLDNYWWGDPAITSVAGISLGFCQWIWFRRKLVKGWWWIVSTLLGWYLALFLMKVFDLSDSNPTGYLSRLVGLIEVLAIPMAFSLPQWFLIRRQFQQASWWWIVARPLAWLTGFGLIALGDWLDVLRGTDFVALSKAAALFGFGFAAVTGIAFIWIQRNPTVVHNHVN